MYDMPDRILVKGCGPGCTRCWRNRLKHANKQAKAYIKKHPEAAFETKWPEEDSIPYKRQQMREAYRRSTKLAWLWSNKPKTGDAELLAERAVQNRRKRLQKQADMTISRPNRRTRRRSARLLEDSIAGS